MTSSNWDTFENVMRRTGYIFVDGPVSSFSTENQQYMTALNASKKKVLDDWVDGLDSSPDIVEKLKTIKQMMNTAFGEDNNQITKLTGDEIMREFGEDARGDGYRYNGWTDSQFLNELAMWGSAFYLTIRFPEVVITNSRGNKHTIKDLYVRATLKPSLNMKIYLSGLRTTITQDELDSGYLHSHLRGWSGSNMNFTGFCLGSGEITQILSLLGQGFSEVNFTLFCIHLKNYVCWESLEGTPYMYMENIGSAGMYPIAQLPADYVTKAAEFMKRHLFSQDEVNTFMKEKLKFSVSSLGIDVTPTDEVEQWMAKVVDKSGVEDLKKIDPYRSYNSANLTCIRDTVGISYNANSRRASRAPISWPPILKFKGENKVLVIESTEDKIKKEKYVHPQITQELCRILSRDFTKIAISAERAKVEEYTVSSEQEAAGSNIFPL